jgi:hypothetical protein
LISIDLVGVGLYIRMQFEETPVLREIEAKKGGGKTATGRGPDRTSPPAFHGRRAEALRDQLYKNRKRLCDQLCHRQTRHAVEPNPQRHFAMGAILLWGTTIQSTK